MRVIIAGGRDFTNYTYAKEILDKLFRRLNKEKLIIISGGARGADAIGERYAREHNIALEIYEADWNRQPDGSYDKSAGYKRNTQMADVSQALVAFWDGRSRGTNHMIKIAEAKNLNVRVIKY